MNDSDLFVSDLVKAISEVVCKHTESNPDDFKVNIPTLINDIIFSSFSYSLKLIDRICTEIEDEEKRQCFKLYMAEAIIENMNDPILVNLLSWTDLKVKEES